MVVIMNLCVHLLHEHRFVYRVSFSSIFRLLRKWHLLSNLTGVSRKAGEAYQWQIQRVNTPFLMENLSFSCVKLTKMADNILAPPTPFFWGTSTDTPLNFKVSGSGPVYPTSISSFKWSMCCLLFLFLCMHYFGYSTFFVCLFWSSHVLWMCYFGYSMFFVDLFFC